MDKAAALSLSELAKARTLGVLGLAARARKLTCGTQNVCDALRLGKAAIVLAATDISDNTKKRLFDRCAYYNIKIALLPVSAQELGNALGRGACAAVALSDASFIKALSKAAQTEL